MITIQITHLQYTCTVESHIQFDLYVSAGKYIGSIRFTLLTTSQLSSSSAQHHRAYPRDRRLQERQLRPGRQPLWVAYSRRLC